MPITVTCPSCSVTFKTKDEYAGKRAKCPKCGEPLTIPVVDTVLMPPPAKAPVAARPVAASKPKPVVDDEADEAPKPKRRRDADDEDEKAVTKRKRGTDDEDEPRAKKGKGDDEDDRPARKRGASDEDEKPKSRKRGDDSDDDKPRSRRRRDDDDEPKKKSKTLPIILGIVGGLLLLCGGGCAGVYFGVIVPAAEKAKKEVDAMASDIKNRAGGDGAGETTKPTKPTKPTPTPEATLGVEDLHRKHATYKGKFVKVVAVYNTGGKDNLTLTTNGVKETIISEFVNVHQTLGGTNLLVNSVRGETFTWAQPPKAGDIVEFIGKVDGADQLMILEEAALVSHTPGGVKTGGGTPGTTPSGNGSAAAPVATLTVDELVQKSATYTQKWVTVKCQVHGYQKKDAHEIDLISPSGKLVSVRCPYSDKNFAQTKDFDPLENLEVVGRVVVGGKYVTVTDAKILRRTPSTDSVVTVAVADLCAEVNENPKAAATKYLGRYVRVTGKVNGGVGGESVRFNTEKFPLKDGGEARIRVGCYFAKDTHWDSDSATGGVTSTFVGRVARIQRDDELKSTEIEIEGCWVSK